MGAEIDFGVLLKAIRRARGLTQEQLARELDVTFGTAGRTGSTNQSVPSRGGS